VFNSQTRFKFVFSKSSNKSKEFVNGLMEEGKIKPHIVKTFKLGNAREAQDFVSAGGVHGKVLLTV
jgi:NADPH:quinone reductase-like Zn-dependent oxidoreductase